jgi:hypothetical protein
MITISIAAWLAQALLQSTPPQAPPPPSPAEHKPLTIAGCAPTEGTAPAAFKLYDPHRGWMYRLTGERLGSSGHTRVQVVGALVPTPNIAAQAGSIDPAGVTVSSANRVNLSGSTPFNQPKLHIEKVRAFQGGCPSY